MTAPPVRILHIVRRAEPMVGGLERYVAELARAQARAGHRVRVVTLDRDVLGVIPGRLPPRERVDGVEILRLPGLGSGRFGITLRPDLLLRAVRSTDVTHLHDVRFMLGSVTAVNRMSGRPTILHSHGLIYGSRAFWRLKLLLSKAYYEPVLRATRTYVACSSTADRDRLLEFMPGLAGQSSVLANGTDLRPFLAVARKPVEGRIVVLGRVTPLKGIDRLLRALPNVEAPWSLDIHGAAEGGEQARLLALADELGIADRVAFHGAYEPTEEARILASANVAVFPSRSEALGLALVDAMAVGVPVLASDIPGHRDALGSETGAAVVDFDDPASVGEAISRLLAQAPAEAEQRAEALRERAGAFEIARLLDELQALYGRLAIQPQGAP